MTVSPNAQAATQAVHDLSHSSTRAGRPFVPVSEMPSPFVPLGEVADGVVANLAARRVDSSIPAHASPEDLPLALAEGGTFRQLVRCWAREESLNETLLKAIGEQEDADRDIEPPADLFVQPEDVALFGRNGRMADWEGRRFYAGTDVMTAIRSAANQHHPGLSEEDNHRRRLRAKAILTAESEHKAAQIDQTERLGLPGMKRAIHWQCKNVSALRQLIVSHRSTNINDVLLKMIVFQSCEGEPLDYLIDRIENNLITCNDKIGTCDDVIRDSIILDLLRMLKGSGLTLEGLCAEGQRHTRAA